MLYCLRRTLILESRLREMENEVLKSTVPEAKDAHVGEDASRNGNVTLKALDASLLFWITVQNGVSKSVVLYAQDADFRDEASRNGK